MGPRLLRAIADTIAVFAVLAGLLGIGLSLLLSVHTRYEAEPLHYLLIGGVALFLVVVAAIIHAATLSYEKRRIIRDCWNAVKDADTLDHDETPAEDPEVVAKRRVDELAAEVVAELAEEMPSERRKRNKRRVKVILGTVAVAVPVALAGALIAMQKKLDAYQGKNTTVTPVVKSGEEKK